MPTKKFFLTTASLILLPLLAACSSAEPDYDFSQKKVITAPVVKKNAQVSETFSAVIEPEKETTLSAKTAGRIKTIYVSAGDEVQKGDLLFDLAGEENSAQYLMSQSAYSNAALNYQNTKMLMQQQVNNASTALETLKQTLSALKIARQNFEINSGEQLTAAQKNIELLETQYQNLIKTEQETLALQKKQVELAEIAVNKTNSSFETEANHLNEGSSSVITQSTMAVNGALSFLFNLNERDDRDREIRISSKFGQGSAQAKIDAENSLRSLKNKKEELQTFYDNYLKNQQTTPEDLAKGEKLAHEALTLSKEALEDMHTVLLKTVTHSELSPEQLSTYNNQLLAQGQNIEQLLFSMDAGSAEGLTGLTQSKEKLSVTKDQQVSQLAKQQEIALQQYALAETSFSSQKSNLQKQLETARQERQVLQAALQSQKDDLDEKIKITEKQIAEGFSGLSTSQRNLNLQVQMSKTALDNAQGQATLGEVSLENTKIYAPYDGVITAKLLEEGSVIGPGVPVLKIADLKTLKLITHIPENEVYDLALGHQAQVQIEAFPQETFMAELTKIEPFLKGENRKVEIEFTLAPKVEVALKSGMYGRIWLKTKPQAEVLALPISAVQKLYGDDIVYVVKDEQVRLRKITLGNVFDEYVTVVDGLQAGEEIVLNGISRLADGDQVLIAETKSY